MWPSSIASDVPVIAFAYAFRVCVFLVSQLFPAPHNLSPCPAMWFPEYVWGSACERHSTFSLDVHALSKTHFLKEKYRLYIHWLWYDLKVCCWTIHVLWAWRVSWQSSLIEFTVDGQVVCDGRPQVHKLMNDLKFVVVNKERWYLLNVLPHDLCFCQADGKSKVSTSLWKASEAAESLPECEL